MLIVLELYTHLFIALKVLFTFHLFGAEKTTTTTPPAAAAAEHRPDKEFEPMRQNKQQ